MKMISKAILTLAAVAVMAVPAMSADKLLVKDTGGNNVFTVTDQGKLGIGVAPVNPFDLQWAWATPGVGTQIIYTTTSIGDVARLTMRRANGTTAVPAALGAGTTIANLNFRGHDGTNWSSAGNAALSAVAEETFTATAQGTRFDFFTTPVGSPPTAAAVRMRIAASGNIGIGSGANAINQKLEVYGGVRVNSTGAITPCDANARGTLWVDLVGTADVVKACVQTAASTFSWKTITLQ